MDYDLFVIGTGLTGGDVALACAEAGWDVAIADERPFGRTCPLRGCDPKKVLVHAAHVLDQARRLDDHGLAFRDLRSTSNPAVYAGGDAAQRGTPLTPVAHIDGHAIEKNLLEGGETPVYDATPTVVFTTPRLASVGLTEQEARAKNLDVEVSAGDASGWYTARHRQLEHAAYKVLLEEESERIVGAHLAYPHAAEIINVFALAQRFGLAAEQLKANTYTYPAAASDVSAMLP